MPKRRAPKKRRKKVKKSRPFFIRRWSIQLFIIGLCVFFSYCLLLDFQLRQKFEGKRWTTPAHVYARELALYPGRRYGVQDLINRLKERGYQPVEKTSGPGQFAVGKAALELFTREFDYPDGVEPAKRFRIEVNKGAISRIIDNASGAERRMLRLEPLLMGKIFPLNDEDRILIAHDAIPGALINALIAIEDRNFYRHAGLDLKGILRSIYVNLSAGQVVQGGSTLTQQLVKNMFLTQERAFSRKIKEMLLALMLEFHYSKASILSAYVNEVYLGQHGARGIRGFGAAAEFYFARPLAELNTAQIALLAGLVKGASYYNPRRHPERALQRRNLVLTLMRRQNFLAEDEYQRLSVKPLQVRARSDWSSARYPAYLDLVRRHLKRDYRLRDLSHGGLHIFTTLDIDKQEAMEKGIAAELGKLERQKGFAAGALQVAMLLADPLSGELLALAGGRDRRNSGFNRALDARRPIGSLIKPAIYMTALDRPETHHVLSPLDDTAILLRQAGGKRWTPKNYDNKPHGRTPLARALARSYNLATVRLGMQVGLDNVIQTLKDLGVKTPVPRLPAILLGSLELSPYEVTAMYQTIANGGTRRPLRAIRAVMDREQRPLRRHRQARGGQLRPQAVFLTQFLLTEAVASGTARRLAAALPALMPLAGKTGTTNALRDSWFAGFGDDLLAVTWIGRDDNRPAGLSGADGALQLWLKIMQQVRPAPFTLTEPAGIDWRAYPDMSRPPGSCREQRRYPFIAGHLPGRLACF